MAAKRSHGDGDDEPRISESPEDWTFRHVPELRELIESVKDALWFDPLEWPRLVLGNLSSMGKAPYSEYDLLWSGNIPRLARYLAATLIPSFPGRAPACIGRPLSTLFFHRSHELKDAGKDHAQPFPGESWFFINGILTNQDVARSTRHISSTSSTGRSTCCGTRPTGSAWICSSAPPRSSVRRATRSTAPSIRCSTRCRPAEQACRAHRALAWDPDHGRAAAAHRRRLSAHDDRHA